MKKCRSCGRRIPFPVREEGYGKPSSIHFCGFCVNPPSKKWIKRYFAWVREEIRRYEEKGEEPKF